MNQFRRSFSPIIRQRARRLRREATDAESLLWFFLRNRRLAGFKFRRQYPYGPYILDFYCPAAGLAVEVDGGQHAEYEQAQRDTERTAVLNAAGIRVIRFWNHHVLNETEAVLETILEALFPSPPSGERGQG